MEDWKRNLIGLIVFGLIVFLIFNQLNNAKTLSNTGHTEIEKLNDSLVNQNIQIDNNIQIIDKISDSLNQNIKVHKQVVTQLKEQQIEKVYRIHNASDVELLEFFAEFKAKDSIYW